MYRWVAGLRSSAVDHEAIAGCVRECFECAFRCTACAEGDLARDERAAVAPAVRSGRHRLWRSRPTLDAIADAVDFCARACLVCAEDCQRHAAGAQRCESCAEAWRRCSSACDRLVVMVAADRGTP